MSVKVSINTKNVELNDRLEEYVNKKVTKLDRYLDELEEARVDLTYNKSARDANDRQIAQLTVRGKGVMLRAEERADDIFTSFDAVMDKITRQIERAKGRRRRGRGDGRTAADVALSAAGDTTSVAVEEEAVDIARRKRHLLIPMDEREAMEQMALLDHENFFIYLDAETNQVNVLYRRRDGSFGLIETEIA
jgi:putative sigma-54 modulation protein